MKTTTKTKTWGRALVTAVTLCAAGAWATENYLDQNGGTKNYGSETQINKTASSQRLILWQGTANINTGASFITGGDSGGSCNFVGVDRGSSAIMNINGGTVWCTTSGGGAGTLGVGNNNYGVTSYLTLNSGILKVDGVLRSAVAYNDGGGATSSGTITINGGEATVGTVYIGASSVNTGTSTLVLNGGKLKTGNITFRKGNGQVFTWTNGTLVATKANIFNVQAFDASNTKTRTMEITGNPAIFNTAGYAQSIPAFTGAGKLRLTGGGAVSFAESTLSYGLVLDGIRLNLDAAAPLTVPSLEITGPVTIGVTSSASLTAGRYPLISSTSSLDGVSLDQITVAGGVGTLDREGNTIYVTINSASSKLLHRWSFNGDYTDSVGGITGTDNNSSVTFINDNTAVRLAGGGKNTSWVELNPGKSAAILPPGDAPFTIEMWTTLRVLTNYSAWFTLGRKDDNASKGLLVAFHVPNTRYTPHLTTSGTATGPTIQAVKSNKHDQNYLIGKNALTAGGTYHLAIVVTPCGDGDGATIEGYIHDATTGERIGGYAYTVKGWTTASLIRESFALGRSFWNMNDPQADYDEVRVWNGALSISQIEANIASGPDAFPAAYTETIDDPFFRYDFTNGTRVFTGNNGTDPAVTGAGNVAVNGPNGPNTAVHPKGFGTIYDGANKLNADWTIAMSVKCCNTEKGVVLSVGSNGTAQKKQFVVATSSTNGKLYVPIFQNYGSAKNIPASVELTNLGDTTNTFHTLVAVHAQGTPYNVLKGGSITLYWDGHPVGSMHAAYQSSDRPFENGFQLSSAHGGLISGYSDLSGNNNLAFQDVRFFNRALSAEEAQMYAEAFPAYTAGAVAEAAIDEFLFRYDFTSGAKAYSHNNHPTEPTAAWSGYTSVNEGTAVHACGTGTITDGDTKLNEDWTLAMSVKPCDVEKGVLLCLGDCSAASTKQLAICSSSTPGRIHIAAIQKDSGGTVSAPLTLPLMGLGDTTNTFHTLAAVHEAGEGTTGLISFYWDGKWIGALDTRASGGELLFGNGFRFSALRTGLSGYADLTGNPDAALRDVRFYTRALPASVIAWYASSVYPAATAAACDLDGYHFRHNFASGKLAVEGSGFTDTSLAGTGTKVMGGVVGSKYAAFPDKTGVGTVSGGLNRDWTLAMSVKAPAVASGENGVMLTLGGVEANGRKALTICSTSDSTGGLFIALPHRYGSNNSDVNTTLARVSLSGLGDITGKYHSLVIVHARNQKNDANAWQTGTFGIYWDGKYVNSIVNNDAYSRTFMDNLRYGGIYNRVPEYRSNNVTYYPKYIEPNEASGLAFQDVRLYTKALSSAEARAYAAEYPVSEPGVGAAYAWWTGGGDPANLNDPENWACTNSVGDVVEGALPIASTVVVLNGNNTFAIPSGSTPVWTTTQVGYGGAVELAADCDWSAFPNLTIADGSYIDLKGHDLKVSYLTAAGEGAYVTNSVVVDALPKLWAENKFVEGDYIDTAKVSVYTDNLEVKAVNDTSVAASSPTLASAFDAGVAVTAGVTTVSGNATLGVSGHDAALQVSGNAALNLSGALLLGNNGASGGTVSVSDSATFAIGGWVNFGISTTGNCLFTQSGGTVTVGNDLNLGLGNTGDVTRYVMSGGTLTVSGSLVPGRSDGTTGGHGVFEQTGGTVNANGYFTIGYVSNSEGSYVMSGGTLNVPSQPVYVGQSNSAKGLLEISGGNATTTKGVWIAASSSSASGTLRLKDSGRLTAASVNRANGAATVEFDGGTLAATGDNASFVSGIANVVFKAGGVTLDTAGHAVAFANCTLKATPGATAITLTGGGTLNFTNTTLNFTEPLSGSFVLAKVSAGNAATFTGVPALADGVSGYKVIRSADGKNIKVVRRGCMLLVE